MPEYRSRLRNEQGMALIGVILLLILASGVCAALAVSGKTETMAAYNLDTSAQARAAAQAGLTAAVQVVITYLNTTALAPTDAVNNLIEGPDDDAAAPADNGNLATIDGAATGLPAPGATSQLASLAGVSYTVQAFDEDDPNRGLMLSGAAITEIDENNSATTDGNKKIVIRAIGRGRNNTTVTLEAIIGTTTLPALVTNGDLDVQGNLTLVGQNGGVHANGNLTLGSGAVDIAEDATASLVADIHASADVGGLEAGGQPTKTVPPVNAADYYSFADYLLDNDGLIKNAQTLAVLASQASYGWTWDAVTSTWELNSDPIDGTYYVRGSVRQMGSPTATMSLIVEGDIDIQGNGTFTPDVQPNFDMLFVTNGDLKISGSFATPLIVEGVILVHGQLNISGSPEIAGQVLVENVAAGGLTDVNEITGNPTITYNGTAGNDTFDLASWREIK